MTPPDSPSALLERAATLIEQRAAEATKGRWERDGLNVQAITADTPKPPPHPGIRQRPLRWGDVEEVVTSGYEDGGFRSEADAERAVLMQPAVAQSLVEWLRDAARRMELHPHLSPEGSTMQRTALAFARQVLGEPLNHDWFFPYDSHPGARECSRCGAHDDSQLCD